LGVYRGSGNGAEHAAGGHLARQDADIAVLERPIRSQHDLDRLLAKFGGTVDVVGGYVDNAEPDFWDGLSEVIEGSPGNGI
jgi:hypothetical protein